MNRLLWIAVIVASCAAGCKPAAPAKHYPVRGEVISADAPKGMIILKHGDIPGLMPAMTMSYMVADADQIKTLRPGDKISADLVVSENKGQLEKIALIEKAGSTPPPSPASPPPAKP